MAGRVTFRMGGYRKIVQEIFVNYSMLKFANPCTMFSIMSGSFQEAGIILAIIIADLFVITNANSSCAKK
jgi:hypothetical protein